MGFAEAVQWWESWQLRVLVLSSLFLQFFLFLAGALRKRRTPPWFRFLTWAAYLGSDALAIYALATLFNRGRKRAAATQRASTAVQLEVLWAPILLLRLGGQDGITAYSLADNELWQRHFLTAASQIVVAIYGFRKSWSDGDKRLLQASILVFVPGILKCLEKPWALRRATISSIASTWGSKVDQDEDDDTAAKKHDKDAINCLKDFVEEAAKSAKAAFDPNADGEEVPLLDNAVKGDPFHLFADLGYPYSVRLGNLQYMLRRRAKVHDRVRAGLSRSFDRFYTKHRAFGTATLRGVLVLLIFVAIRLFHQSRRAAYDGADVKVTYVLLCCTAALEFVSAGTMAMLGSTSRPPWPDRVAQCNLIAYHARSLRRRRWRRISSLLRCQGSLERVWCPAWVKPASSRGITELVHDHLAGGWKRQEDGVTDSSEARATEAASPVITDVKTYREFNDSRGRWTLKKERCTGTAIESSLRRPFDESLVLWHLATDLCFYDHVDSGSEVPRRCREISNYLAHLLLTHPEMFMPGARSRILNFVAHAELRSLLKEIKPEDEDLKPRQKKKTPPLRSEEDVARRIIQKVKCNKGKGSGLVHDAWELAEALMRFAKEEDGGEKGEEKMWTVVQGVWVEMLCFSAGRCRGYLHAKSLGAGGEYLSYVWLLREFMGMETLAQKTQRADSDDEGDLGTAAPKSTPRLVTGADEENALRPSGVFQNFLEHVASCRLGH